MDSGNLAAARDLISAALREQPQNGGLHLLSGLTYQMESDSVESLNLAKVGYDAAVKFAPGNYWSHYFAGAAALELRAYPEAADHFCSAILAEPDKPQAFLGLASAAYLAGDLGVARAATDRALILAPQDPLAIQAAAFVAAAQGSAERVEAVLAGAQASPDAKAVIDHQRGRIAQILHTASRFAASQEPADARPEPPGRTDPAPATVDSPRQVMVEVTLLLNQEQETHSTGINLLDGLTAQFGLDLTTSSIDAPGGPDTFSRVFTTALQIPQITYSLNLFNTKRDFYRVIARPSLVAYLDQTSEFFIGRTVTVGVSGINLGSLQPIDVGTTVRVTPSEISNQRAKFKVDVTRSFLVQNTAGTFDESITTYKQSVDATAEIEFGRTLILSALYEAVDVGASSKTPGLGDIPVLDTVFNARTRTDRQDVALVLLTPRLVGSIETESRTFRGETLKRVLSLWSDLVDPTSNLDSIVEGSERMTKTIRRYSPRVGDVRPPEVSDADVIRAAVGDTLAQM